MAMSSMSATNPAAARPATTSGNNLFLGDISDAEVTLSLLVGVAVVEELDVLVSVLVDTVEDAGMLLVMSLDNGMAELVGVVAVEATTDEVGELVAEGEAEVERSELPVTLALADPPLLAAADGLATAARIEAGSAFPLPVSSPSPPLPPNRLGLKLNCLFLGNG